MARYSMRSVTCAVAAACIFAWGDRVEAQPAQPAGKPQPAAASLTLIPPATVSDEITLDVRGAVWNHEADPRDYRVTVYLNRRVPEAVLHDRRITVPAGETRAVAFRWPAKGHAGEHRLILVAESPDGTSSAERPLNVLATGTRSTKRLGGAWVDIYHHDEREGRPFNDELAKMTDRQWRELVGAMHAVDQDLLVITMVFQNFTHVGRHAIETEGYRGRAYYPSRLFPGRMPIATEDPLEAIFDEADRLGMHVMPGVGCYAFFDFTPASLQWHKQVARELWGRYGHHPSFYGWYVSEEIAGNLGADDQRRRELVAFFQEFTPFARGLAADKPVMLATNAHLVDRADGTYEKLLPHLDVLCPFGFHRMPEGDMTGEAAAAILQRLCDEAGCHLWMDLESFVFRNGVELHPRPIAGLVDDLGRFPGFENVLHYQFPGMMSSPAMSRQPGGPASVQLYLDYQRYLQEGRATPRGRGAAEGNSR